MSITVTTSAFVEIGVAAIGLSQMFSGTVGSNDPTYLVLTVLDRNEYTAGATGLTGSLSGNGYSLPLSSLGGDGRGTGIIFTYQNGRYYNATYGYLDQMTYTSSGSLNDVTNLSLFGTNSLSLATNYGTNAYAMVQQDAAGYLGSITVVTQPHFTAPVPAQATPASIAAIANSFVGAAWNMSGCWVLCSTIAAEAGTSLPVQSTLIGVPGQANGEWIVAFNGPAGQTGNWQSMVTAGEMVVIGTSGGGGHITTCVSGTGSTAMLVDNATYVDANGKVVNPANDGSSSDIIIHAPHLASQEWSGVAAASVVIYELDTPIVTATVTSDSLAFLASQSLGSLFAVTDPGNKTITSWQVYDTASSDWLVVNNTQYGNHSAASALTVASLSSVSLLAGSTATTDTLEVRAFNGTYWGDWQQFNVTITATVAPLPSPPVPVTQTANQTWTGGKAFSLALPAGTFTDPQNQTLTYSAKLSNGQALPSWLKFNAATDTFSGTAPISPQTLGITVTATDTSGLSASDSFSATVLAGPALANQTPNQTWTPGKAISFILPANTFSDAQGSKMTYAASQIAGSTNVTSWLHFNATTGAFSGTVAKTATGTVTLKVVATDTNHLSASETFMVTFGATSGHVTLTGVSPISAAGMLALHF